MPADRASPAPGPAEVAESAEVSARVRGAIAALPAGQRDAVRMFYLQGLSHIEVAGELGVSVGRSSPGCTRRGRRWHPGSPR